MNERMENYLLDHIARLTDKASKQKESIKYWHDMTIVLQVSIDQQGAKLIENRKDLETFRIEMMKKDDVISMWEGIVLEKDQKIMDLENQLEAQSCAD